jgi:putative ABC transport system ATP-binding protein
MPLMQVKGLGKTVRDADGQLDILRDIHVDLHAGETVAVVGASGSGKSTLLGLMAGMDVPSAGEVLWSGQPFSSWSEDERARWRGARMGFVFQNFQLLPHLTALENVSLALELQGASRARERAQAMLEKVGLGQRMNHLPRLLSGGEQQRVALARAFVVGPQVLLADEPTGSLDAATGERIVDLMFSLNTEAGTTLVLVTHDPSLAQRCQRRLHLERGVLTEEA